MTVTKQGTIQRFIGASTDTKPTSVNIGSTFLEYDTSEMYTTYDGSTWVQKKSAPFNNVRIVRSIKTLEASAIYHANDVLSESVSADKATVWTFLSVVDGNGGAGVINAVRCLAETTSASGDVYLDLYSASSPGCNLIDHASNTSPVHGDVTASTFLGRIHIQKLAGAGSGDAVAIATTETASSGLPLTFVCGSSTNSIFGVSHCLTALGVNASTDMMFALEIEKR